MKKLRFWPLNCNIATPVFAGVGEVAVIMRRRIPAAVERRVMGERKKVARKGRKGRKVRRGRGTVEGRWTQQKLWSMREKLRVSQILR